ncbi:hypothetical protein HYDPIDRAFT_105313 [Hydnomerulius pinastri MD-312]|nr:hypothetical protein HYDPIDRAFT_105313 [Hydnomerulius pinastri MD-312]
MAHHAGLHPVAVSHEMISSPTKRILTDDEHATRLASEVQRSDAVPFDLAASIRAASMRARKTVTEGYLTQPSSSTTPLSSPVKQAPTSPTATSLPVPANETFRQVFSSATSGKYTPQPSPLKRRRSDADLDAENQESADTLFVVDRQSEDQGGMMVDMSSDEMEVERPVKPLRRSGRIRMETSPPPVGLLFPGRTDMNSSRQRDAVEGSNVASSQDVFLESASDVEAQ